jgi:hypothetical protein
MVAEGTLATSASYPLDAMRPPIVSPRAEMTDAARVWRCLGAGVEVLGIHLADVHPRRGRRRVP